MTREEFRSLARGHVVLLDGATGSNLRAAGMPPGACPEQWILEHPESLLVLQKGYTAAGSQILYAPTFTANRRYLDMYGCAGYLAGWNRQLVALSRRAAGASALVAGDMTTLGRRDIPDKELFDVYAEQAGALIAAGVDLFVVETMLGGAESVIALEAIRSLCALPVMCTLSVEADGRTYFGDDGAEVCRMLAELGADAVGVNCSSGPQSVLRLVERVARAVDVPVVAKPNAGLPDIDAAGNARYAMTPAEFARGMQKLIAAGATIVGGCCGTTPEHLAALRKAAG